MEQKKIGFSFSSHFSSLAHRQKKNYNQGGWETDQKKKKKGGWETAQGQSLFTGPFIVREMREK